MAGDTGEGVSRCRFFDGFSPTPFEVVGGRGGLREDEGEDDDSDGGELLPQEDEGGDDEALTPRNPPFSLKMSRNALS